ncbi:MAG: serine hydrolase [Candidatus Omnitrophica bacterium]|nr:serine hydrolase [Candidatus Omnitrophota bacterium]
MTHRATVVIAVALSVAAGAAASVAVQAYRRAQDVTQAQRALAKLQANWQSLQQRIDSEIRSFNGDVGFVIKDLETGWRLTHQPEHRFPSASLVKIAIMAACFQAVQEGQLELSSRLRFNAADRMSGSGVLKDKPVGTMVTVEALIPLMIAESDNTATNMLINRLGLASLNRSFQALGLRQTNLARKMMDFAARAKGIENYTTATEMAFLLERLYRQELVSPDWSRRGLELLKQQKLRDRIPAQLPPETVVAHKTGLENHICHDAGIVLTPKGDFLIVVLTRHKGPSKAAKVWIANLALHTYRYVLNSPRHRRDSRSV